MIDIEFAGENQEEGFKMVNSTAIVSILFSALALPIVLNFIVLSRAERKYQGEA